MVLFPATVVTKIILLSVLLFRVNAEQWNNAIADNVGVFHSLDAKTWSAREKLAQLESQRSSSLAVLQPPGRQIMAYFSDANRPEPIWLQFQERAHESYKPVSMGIGGIGSHDAALAFHPKWGYLMTWSTPRRFGWGNTLEGPFVMRGQSLDTIMYSGDQPRPVKLP